MFQQSKLLFKRTKQCFVPCLLYGVYILSICIYQLMKGYIYNKGLMSGLGSVTNILNTVLIGCIVFLFVTCEYFSQARMNQVEECLSTGKRNIRDWEWSQFLVCVWHHSFIFLLLVIVAFICCAMGQILSKSMLIYILCALFFHYYLVIIISILLGWLLSYIKIDLFRYVSMVGIAFYLTVRDKQLFVGQEELYEISDFTQFFCVDANWVENLGFKYSVEPHFIIKPVMFILIVGLFILSVQLMRDKKTIYCLYISVFMILIFGGYQIWNQPVSGCYYGYSDDTPEFYAGQYEEQHNHDFYVENYDIELVVDNGLHVDVMLTPSKINLETYRFTLFDNFNIVLVQDKEGNALTYTYQDHILTIENSTGKLESVHLVYEGRGTNYAFAGSQGICLPGNYPYYPIAGANDLYDPGLTALSDMESFFDVTVEYDKEIFSNLEQSEKNHFIGYSNNLTLLAGFWNEKEYDGITYIYPTTEAYCDPEKNLLLYNEIQKYLSKEIENQIVDYTLKGKKILIHPYDYAGSICMFGSDMLMIGSYWDFSGAYTNYLQTGYWYTEDTMSEEELQEWLEENLSDEEKAFLEEQEKTTE